MGVCILIKQLNRFLFFVFVFGCYASANFLKASAEESFPHITTENVSEIPVGGTFTFESVILPNLNNFPMALIALANGLKVPEGPSWKPLPEVSIHVDFFPAKDFDGTSTYPTTIYLPGSAGVKQSEKKEITRLTEQGEHVFAIKTNYSHVKKIIESKGVSLTDEEIKRKAATSDDQLKANPLNQVADTMRLLKILQGSSIVNSEKVTVFGQSLGAVSAILCAMPEFAGPLTPGSVFVNDPENKYDHDIWAGVPNFRVVATSPLLPIMPLNPHFTREVLIISGSNDNFCEIWPNIHVLQKAMKDLKVTFQILQGVGHLPEGCEDEYDLWVANSKSGGIVKREKEGDYFMRKGQNLSDVCFHLGQNVSFFRQKESEDMKQCEGRIMGATFILNGRGPWNKGEELSLMKDFVYLHKLITLGTSIKLDREATDFIHDQTDKWKKSDPSELKDLAADQCISLQEVKTEEDMKNYAGFVTKKEILAVSKTMNRDEIGDDDPIR